MKKQHIYLFFSLLFALQLFSQNTTQLYLKGKVKSIHETYQKCPTVALEGSTFKCLEKDTFFTFDKKGNAIGLNAQNTNFDNYIVVKTSTDQGYKITEYLIWDGVKRKHFEEYYNKKGNKIKVIGFHNDGEITNIWEYIFTKKGEKVEEISTSFWNGNTKMYHYFYNAQGDVALCKHYENGKIIKEEKFEIKYTFDKKGNWLTKTIQAEYNESYKRTIEYY